MRVTVSGRAQVEPSNKKGNDMDDLILIEEAESRARIFAWMLAVSVCMNVTLFLAWMLDDAERAEAWMRVGMGSFAMACVVITPVAIFRILTKEAKR